MLESRFQAMLIKEIKKLLPNAMVFKMDPTYIQGTPDLLVLYKKKWAMLECKKGADSAHRPNQDYYIRLLNAMSFARFICPENKKEVLDDMVRSLKGFSAKRTRIIQPKPTSMDE